MQLAIGLGFFCAKVAKRKKMIAYLIHNSETQTDTFYLPAGECYLTADRVRMQAFISVDPDFGNWSQERCRVIPPEEFGGVIAFREDKSELQVLNPELWQQCLKAHLGNSLFAECSDSLKTVTIKQRDPLRPDISQPCSL